MLSAEMRGQAPQYYLGHSYQQIMASGRDMLGEAMLRDGEPDFERVATLLPPLHKKTYSFVGGAASWGNVVVDDAGNIYPRYINRDFLFSPASVDSALAAVAPQQRWMDGRKPLLILNFAQGERSMELLYFVDSGDPDRDPLVWIRARVKNGSQTTEKYLMASASRKYRVKEIDAKTFDDTYNTVISYWDDFLSRTASFAIPNSRLARVAQGAMTSMAITFSGDHPHYGHLNYSLEANDNFPPNYIWSTEACCLTGRFDMARRYLDHLFCYGSDSRGRFNYRQGDLEMRSSSAVEYSQILCMMSRYSQVLKLDEWATPYLAKITGMGDEMLSYLVATPETDGMKLIRMCAEADTNGREYVYMNNNLWAVRGLKALAELLTMLGDKNRAAFYQKRSDELLANVHG